jgi:hydroxymethylglutaryl-CoA lyase
MVNSQTVKLIECPRDAMQGILQPIDTELKAAYINALLRVGFDIIDFGSFVSPKAIPQMADTADVLKKLDLDDSASKLLAIVANERGAEEAASYDEIHYLGFPFSISEEFQKRNTNSTIEESLGRVAEISKICHSRGKEAVIYISMAFGNPYGESWHPEVALQWTKRLRDEFGFGVFAMSDTIGCSEPWVISSLFQTLRSEMSEVEFGAHFHTTPDTWREKVESAFDSGCLRFDGALKGFGGCPMAKDDLTGNMPTERMIDFFGEKGAIRPLNREALEEAMSLSSKVFGA